MSYPISRGIPQSKSICQYGCVPCSAASQKQSIFFLNANTFWRVVENQLILYLIIWLLLRKQENWRKATLNHIHFWCQKSFYITLLLVLFMFSLKKLGRKTSRKNLAFIQSENSYFGSKNLGDFNKNTQVRVAFKSLHPENSQEKKLKSFIRFESFSMNLGLSSCKRKMQMWFCIAATCKVNETFEGQEPNNMFILKYIIYYNIIMYNII